MLLSILQYTLTLFLFFFFLMTRPPPSSPLFPYTPLFRSLGIGEGRRIQKDQIPGRATRRAQPFPAVGLQQLVVLAREHHELLQADCREWLGAARGAAWEDRKSTRLNSSHQIISYAVFCLQ